jgi:CTP synthase
MQGMGINPNIIVLRTDEKITDESIFSKIAHFCNVKPDCVIENYTVPVLYEAPLMLEQADISSIVCRELHIDAPAPDLAEWREMVERVRHQNNTVKIGLVGKYVQLHDAYLSVAEALRHAGYVLDAKVEITWIDSETLTEENIASVLEPLQGVIVPGGFGSRGIEGMILTAQYAREHHIPYFGICLGMQIAVIEYARNKAGLTGANSHEFDDQAPYQVIHFMPGQNEEIDKGGTLRLGKYPCRLEMGTVIAKCYGRTEISERHRHRYEFANEYRDALQKAGLMLSGLSPDGRLVETVELPEEEFFVGVQFHPEFKSRPNKPHPLFNGLVKASAEYMEARKS